jgi:hypothetical protein
MWFDLTDAERATDYTQKLLWAIILLSKRHNLSAHIAQLIYLYDVGEGLLPFWPIL